ncbi:MAG: SDR family NAD(P)-dependent oxidoreductase [Coxiellaceae bacterium]|nr:SDR family NAD(P)-dependent oxidoreductase [Coxiellaceae bacterium]
MKPLIIISGTTRGIGHALAKHCLQQGHHVVGINRSPCDLNDSHRDTFHMIKADLSNTQDIQLAIHETLQYCTQNNCSISHLVNNAGTNGTIGSLTKINSTDYTQLMNINVTAPLLLTNGLLKHFNNTTRVLNLSSRAAEFTAPGLGAYCMSKHALLALTEAYQQDDNTLFLCGHVIPGEVDTGIQAELREQDEINFPLAKFFKQNQTNLIPAPVSASFIYWLLTQTSNNEFSRKEPWFIYDNEHHKQWYSDREPFPYPAP